MTTLSQQHLDLLRKLGNLAMLNEQELLDLYAECASAETELLADYAPLLQKARDQISDLVNALRALRMARLESAQDGRSTGR